MRQFQKHAKVMWVVAAACFFFPGTVCICIHCILFITYLKHPVCSFFYGLVKPEKLFQCNTKIAVSKKNLRFMCPTTVAPVQHLLAHFTGGGFKIRTSSIIVLYNVHWEQGLRFNREEHRKNTQRNVQTFNTSSEVEICATSVHSSSVLTGSWAAPFSKCKGLSFFHKRSRTSTRR